MELTPAECAHGLRKGTCVQCRDNEIRDQLENRIAELEAENEVLFKKAGKLALESMVFECLTEPVVATGTPIMLSQQKQKCEKLYNCEHPVCMWNERDDTCQGCLDIKAARSDAARDERKFWAGEARSAGHDEFAKIIESDTGDD